MNDSLLQMLQAADCAAGGLIDAVGLLGYYALVSDTIPTTEGVALGSERVALEVVCDVAFDANPVVNMYLVSGSTADKVSLLTEFATGVGVVHWASGPIGGAAFRAGRRMATIPLPPGQEYRAQIGLIVTFASPGVTGGQLSARITYPTTRVHFPAPNAI